MNRSTILRILCIASLSACVVKAKTEPTVRDHRTQEEPYQEPPPPVVRDHRTPREEPPPPPVVRDHRSEPGPSFDSTGWTLIGEQWVEGRRDHDTIRVGGRQGRFTKVTVVVDGSDLRMDEFLITFGDGKTQKPKMEPTFREGSRSRAIDLEGKARVIKQFDFKYGNLPGGGRAKVQIWGIPEGGAGGGGGGGGGGVGAPPPPSSGWDSTGWTLIGEQWVEGRRDHDTIRIGPRKGRFTKVTVVVEGSDLRMDEFVITYDDGKKHKPKMEPTFGEGSRSRAIDLEGKARVIKQVDFKYGNLPGGGRAKVQIWGIPG